MTILDEKGNPIQETFEQPQFVTLKELWNARAKLNKKYPPNSDDVPMRAKVGDMNFYLTWTEMNNGHRHRSWIYEGRVAME